MTTLFQDTVICALDKLGPSTPRQVADWCCLTRQQAAGRMESLIKRGLVEKMVEGRVVTYKLTVNNELRERLLREARPNRVSFISEQELEVFTQHAHTWREFVRPATLMAEIAQGVVGYMHCDDGDFQFTVGCQALVQPFGSFEPTTDEQRQQVIDQVAELINKRSK